MCLSFIIGVFLSSFFEISDKLTLVLLILGISVFVVFYRHQKTALCGLLFILFSIGLLRHQTVYFKARNNEIIDYFGTKQTISAVVVKEPVVKENVLNLTLGELNVINENQKAPVDGRILLISSRYPEYSYGDILEVRGIIYEPQELEEFNYKDYLLKDRVYGLASFSEIRVLGNKADNSFNFKILKGILSFKEKLSESVYRNLSPPYSSILGAMILGDKSRLSKELKDKLNASGLRHITAISGMHVVILTGILMSLFLGLGFWRHQAFYLSIFFIFIFVLMTGVQVSAIRAGIMGSLFLLAQKFGRKSTSFITVVFVGSLMLFLNPLLLRYDVGFQLSFLAVLGIILFGDVLEKRLRFIPLQKVINLRSNLSITFSAQVFTLPILIYNFGTISLVSLISNILILPILYWIMIFGFISGFLGIIWGFLGWISSFFSWFFLGYMVLVIDFFSKSWFQINIGYVSWVWLFVFYLILGFIVWLIKRREKLNFMV